MCSAAAAEATGSGLPGGSVPTGAAARRVAALFVRQPALCLERAVGEKHGIDQNLWDSCHFQAEIYPDLPLATTWRDLLRRTVQTAGHESEVGRVEPPPKVCPAERWTVRTVAAQLRSRDQLRSMMLSAAGVDPAGDPKPGVRPADALLFVSGSHPARHLPGAGRCVEPGHLLVAHTLANRAGGAGAPLCGSSISCPASKQTAPYLPPLLPRCPSPLFLQVAAGQLRPAVAGIGDA